MDPIRLLQDAAARGDVLALAALADLASQAPQHKRAPGVEHKVIPAALSIKAEGRRIIGYGSTFEPPENYDDYGDIIRPGAFAGSLARLNAAGEFVRMDDMHLDPVGKWEVVEEDLDAKHGKRGLYVEGEPLDTSKGNDMLALIKGGIYRGLSIGYQTVASRFLDGYEGRPLVLTKWGYPVREIIELNLIEVSPCPKGANRYAEILGVRMARREVKYFAPRSPDHTDHTQNIDALCARMAAQRITSLKDAARAAAMEN